jgi:hypothetical protein
MDALTQARQQLDALLADLEQREQSVAQAAELLSQEPAIAAAWQQGGMSERDRVVSLIDLQLDQLSRGGVNAIVLTALRRQVLEVDA